MHPSFVPRLSILLFGPLITSAIIHAQSVGTGTIEGRVFNTLNGEYLEKARITIEGTDLEAFTDASGQYRLTNVPVGVARVKIFYTGQDVLTDTVNVAAGTLVN